MTTIEKSVDVEVPVSTAYNQWTQFESFPRFMEGVENITQVSDTRTHWVTSIGGVKREFDAEITEQHPDERVAWHTVEGPQQAGVVTFHRLNDRQTRVHLQMDYEPETLTEKAGAALGIVEHRVNGDLKRFKEFIENAGSETGSWRGDVPREPQAGEGGHRMPPGGAATTPNPGATPGVAGPGVTPGLAGPGTGGPGGATHRDPLS
ncbi:SRPBCC family protein [Actinosynnema pretiosum subsp. pretiosum]|uniref:Cyclase/dehydrase n=2 Tax=Actinosynnema TaxID=40566 RepID=C6WE06_ACTMD|nr:cyclase/dehydrase [Actinosynnema mirum DSM 43827]AXX29171.1 cyclase/dehydrase [Actinosynnema pretiosum subsp. pretiosum]QUF06557.1 SRPBCC family protein [Actinosynnema pretiosum subsp. pretiosum]